MAVPANPKLSQVIAEFETPANTRLSQFLRNGAYVMDSPTNAGVPTTLPIRLSQLAGATKAPPPPVVSIVGGEVWAAGAAAGGTYARYYLTSGGLEQTKAGNTTAVTLGTWLLSGAAADCEVRATVLGDDGGAIMGGEPVGTWLNLGTTREWNYGNGGIGETGGLSLKIEVRLVSTGVIQDTANVFLNSERV